MTWIEAGNGLFNISTPDETWQLPETGASGSVIKVYVEDFDRHFDRAKAQGPRLLPSRRTDSGVVGSTAALDHEGHRWEISQRGRDLSAERWQLPPGVTRGVSK